MLIRMGETVTARDRAAATRSLAATLANAANVGFSPRREGSTRSTLSETSSRFVSIFYENLGAEPRIRKVKILRTDKI